MNERVRLPEDELAHSWPAIEWWYFNGFLEGKKNKYAFMTCLFKADKEKVNLSFLKVPFKTVYFAHTLVYDLKNKTIEKEILPVVLVSEDSFTKDDLFINYAYLLRKQFFNYEIARSGKKMRIKTRFFDLNLEEKKKPIYEGGKGYIDLGSKTTYYYSYPRLKVEGMLRGEKVKGWAWHDKQWSKQGFMEDYWLWFSLQLPDHTDIVCFDYKSTKMATISHKNNKQETVPVEFISMKNNWKSKDTNITYPLSWKIKIKDMIIQTSPVMNNCEMNHGFISYWEGPVNVKYKGTKFMGFMEILSKQPKQTMKQRFEQLENSAKQTLELWSK
jgi:predicted secreted hydrolase